MLHVTNGDSAVAVLRAAGVPGEILPWNDVLHEGPVPAGLTPGQLSAMRACFIAEQAWAPLEDVLEDFAIRDDLLRTAASGDEVVLWFEHDLYDQLQLIQVLSLLAVSPGSALLTAVVRDEYLGHATPGRLSQLFAIRAPVTDPMLAAATAAWEAFRAPDPRGLEAMAAAGTPALPFLGPAIVRHLEQFPGTRDGLSRSERQAMSVLAAGPVRVGDLFGATQRMEDPVWLGDLTFVAYLAGLGACDPPLVRRADGAAFAPPAGGDGAVPRDAAGGLATELALTPEGREVLAGRADRVALCGLERWLGGVRLQGREAAYRWDAGARRIVAAA
jgi:hypothetical protein